MSENSMVNSDGIPPAETSKLDPTVARNVRILARSFVPNTPPLTDPAEEEIHTWQRGGERRMEGETTMLTALTIRYNTRTGEIAGRVNFDDTSIRDGDYSVLRTWLVSEGETVVQNDTKSGWVTTRGKYKILLTYPKGWLSPQAMDAAVNEQFGTGDATDALAEEKNWILPERIDPEMVREYGSNITGIWEPWGKSNLVKNPQDMKLFRAIEVFNETYGPSLTEQFFRKAA